MTEKIGRVSLNLDYYDGEDRYSDGDVEEELLEIVKIMFRRSSLKSSGGRESGP